MTALREAFRQPDELFNIKLYCVHQCVAVWHFTSDNQLKMFIRMIDYID